MILRRRPSRAAFPVGGSQRWQGGLSSQVRSPKLAVGFSRSSYIVISYRVVAGMPPEVLKLFQDHAVAGTDLLQLTQDRLRDMGEYAAASCLVISPLPRARNYQDGGWTPSWLGVLYGPVKSVLQSKTVLAQTASESVRTGRAVAPRRLTQPLTSSLVGARLEQA